MNDERAAGNVIGSFDEIILPHLDAAHNLARWLLRGSNDAEDVVQEACMRAVRYFATYHGGNARSWLLRIVRNTAVRWLQKNRAHQFATELDEEIHGQPGDGLNPETVLLQRADTHLVEQAMKHLPIRLREVLMLRELEGLSYKEIAEVVGVPMGTVMSTLFRARERFRLAVSDLVKRQAQSTGSSALSQAKPQQIEADSVPV